MICFIINLKFSFKKLNTFLKEKVKNFIKENLNARFLKRRPQLSILITVKCRMAVSREDNMSEKRLWKGKSWYSLRKVSQETEMPLDYQFPLLFVRALE